MSLSTSTGEVFGGHVAQGCIVRTTAEGEQRADYGQPIVVSLSRQLSADQGPSFGEKNLRRMIQFAQISPPRGLLRHCCKH